MPGWSEILAAIMISGMLLVFITAVTSPGEVGIERNPGDW